jgi:hypothetical protein
MTDRKAYSLATLLAQVDALSPNRDTASDGWIGDKRHQAKPSDHNPNSKGVVCAIDIDDDPAHGVDNAALAHAIIRDRRVNYVIFDGKIMSGPAGSNKLGVERSRGKGPSDHAMHLHISVSQDPKLYDDSRPWDLSGLTVKPGQANKPANKRPIVVLAKGPNNDRAEVKKLQTALNELGTKPKLDVDGFFGDATDVAVKKFQKSRKLVDDGVVGRYTRKELGI